MEDMKDSQILSTFEHSTAEKPASPANALVLDACHVGVVLRSVVLVQLVMMVAAMFGAASPWHWLEQVALLTGAALPGTVVWLLVMCVVKRWLRLLSIPLQQFVAVLMGAVCGVYGCALLAFADLLGSAPWWASAASGALLAALQTATQVLRSRAQTPAATVARLRELQARIRPHFLFNTLNSAIALVRAEPEKAERLLEDLSDLFRQALKESGDAVSLAEEIALAQRYLAIEKIRFGDRIRVEWALDPRADDARLPPLLLQPLVENAVRHGVEPCTQGADVKISTQCRGSTVVIKVSNTVPVDHSVGGCGLALDNVRERLSLLHDIQATFQCGLKNGLFQVRIEIPL